MSIETVEDGKKYLTEIHRHLKELTRLSTDAEVYSHAAIWATIDAAFCHSMEEIKTISHMMKMYLDASIERYMGASTEGESTHVN